MYLLEETRTTVISQVMLMSEEVKDFQNMKRARRSDSECASMAQYNLYVLYID